MLLKSLYLCRYRTQGLSKAFLRSLSSNINVRDALATKASSDSSVKVQGWVRSAQSHKGVTFLQVNDGSCLSNLQVVVHDDSQQNTASMGYGSCVEVEGTLAPSKGKQQSVELQAETVNVVGKCDAKAYPLKRNKHHPMEYLRDHLHLRCRTNTFGALTRIRNAASQAVHRYFQENDFLQIHTPILTSNDCEGAGEVFTVEPSEQASEHLDRADPQNKQGQFFGVPTFLTVSGQLHLEVMNGAFEKVYTFSPTFRAENSRGRHHLSEFSMVEAEIAFIHSIEDVMKVIESLTRSICQHVQDTCSEDVEFYMARIADKGHKNILQKLTTHNYLRITYTDAIKILENNNEKFQFKVKWGCDLQKEHERYLVHHCGEVPLFVTDFPAQLKPFYARQNEDADTVAAVDLLAPGVGELCGGSLREERLEVLQPRLEKLGLSDSYQWYLDLRQFGSTPHGGFGVGFERLIQTMLGIQNIKDTLLFPRARHSCKM